MISCSLSDPATLTNQMSECVICCETFTEELPPIKCDNPECKCEICSSCLEQLISFSYSTENLPVCPGQDCESNYPYRTLVSELDSKVFYNYARAILNYFKNLNANEINFNVRKSMSINQLRIEKLEFLKNSFPKGVIRLCEIALPGKLHRVKTLEDKIFKKVKIGEPCPMTSCQGFLKPDTKKCVLCRIQFCESCLKRKDPGHLCAEEDLATMRELNSYIRCPGCTLPVFKDFGCSSITCSNCKTNFTYKAECPLCHKVTDKTKKGSFHCVDCDHVFLLESKTLAKTGGHGSSNTETNLSAGTFHRSYEELIKELPDGEEIYTNLQELEINLHPPIPSEDPIKKYIVDLEIISSEKPPETAEGSADFEVREKRLLVRLVKAFDKFTHELEEQRFYIEDMEYLEKLIKKKQLRSKHLREVMRDYQ